MKNTAIIFAAVSLLSSIGAARAEDYKWIAVITLEGGVPQNCGDGNVKAFVEMKGNTLIGEHNSHIWKVDFDMSSLKPDGSGRLWRTGEKKRRGYLELEAGVGPRIMHGHEENSSCYWLWTPHK